MATESSKSVVQLIINGEGAKTSLKEIGSALNSVNKELRNLKEADNPAEYQKLIAQKRNITEEYLKQKSAIGDVRSGWQKFKSEFSTIATGVLGGNILTWMSTQLMSVIPAAIDKVIKKKDELANIARTTGMTDDEVRQLDKDLRSIDTRTTQTELRNMASVAGQFGIANKDIRGFVENVDKAAVSLKELGGAEQTATTLAQLDNIFKDIEGNTIGDRVLHIANSLNVLEAAGVATSPVIADFTSRMGAALVPLRVGADKVLGMSAALQEMNITAERGSTAVIEAFQRMLTETNTFAKVAGMSTKEYKKLIEQDIWGAIMKYLEGLQKVKGSQLEFMAALDKSKLSGSGALQTISSMVDNLDTLKSKVNLAGSALKNTDSIQNEFNKNNYALAVNLKKLGEWWNSLYHSSGMESLVTTVVNGAAAMLGLVDKVALASKEFENQKNKVQNLEKNINPLIERYDTLKFKVKLNSDEQKELKDIIGKLASAVPSAVSEMDKYGKALAINTWKARDAVSAQKELMKYYNKNAISESESELEDLRKRRSVSLDMRRKGTVTTAHAMGSYEKPLSEQELSALDVNLAKMREDERAIIARINALKGDETASIEERRAGRRGTVAAGGAGGTVGGGTKLDLEDKKDKKRKEEKKKSEWLIRAEEQQETEKWIKEMLDTYSDYDKEQAELKKKEMENSISELTSWYDMQDAELEMSNASKLVKDESYYVKKSELQQKYIAAEIAIRKAAGEDTAELERKLSGVIIEETNTRNEKTRAGIENAVQESKRLAEGQAAAQQMMQDSWMSAGQGIVGIAKMFTKESTGMFKTLLIVERALAIADVVIKTQREIAAYYATWAAVPGGPAIASGFAAGATIRAGVSIATIAAQTIADVAGREHGGYTGIEDLRRDTNGGYVNRPTLFDFGQRKYIAGEGNKREFVISSAALQYQPVANFAAMLDSVQRTRNFSALAQPSPAYSGGGMSNGNGEIVSAIARLESSMNAMQSRPVNFNYDKFEQFQNFIFEINKQTSA